MVPPPLPLPPQDDDGSMPVTVSSFDWRHCLWISGIAIGRGEAIELVDQWEFDRN